MGGPWEKKEDKKLKKFVGEKLDNKHTLIGVYIFPIALYVSAAHVRSIKLKITEARSSKSAVVSFVGSVDTGKSFLARKFLLSCDPMADVDVLPKARAPEQEIDGGMTGNVDHFWIPDFHILDCEGIGGMPSKRSDALASYIAGMIGGTKAQLLQKRENFVNQIFPSLMYLLSDVMVFVSNKTLNDSAYFNSVEEILKAVEGKIEGKKAPTLILVANLQRPGLPFDIDEDTKQFQAALQLRDTMEERLMKAFDKVYFLRIPTTDLDEPSTKFLTTTKRLMNWIWQESKRHRESKGRLSDLTWLQRVSASVDSFSQNATTTAYSLISRAAALNARANRPVEIAMNYFNFFWDQSLYRGDIKIFCTMRDHALDFLALTCALQYGTLAQKGSTDTSWSTQYYRDFVELSDLLTPCSYVKAGSCCIGTLHSHFGTTEKKSEIKEVLKKSETKKKPGDIKVFLNDFMIKGRETHDLLRIKDRKFMGKSFGTFVDQRAECISLHEWHLTLANAVHMLHQEDDSEGASVWLNAKRQQLLDLGWDVKLALDRGAVFSTLPTSPTSPTTHIASSQFLARNQVALSGDNLYSCPVCFFTLPLDAWTTCGHPMCRRCEKHLKVEGKDLVCPICRKSAQMLDDRDSIPILARPRLLSCDGGGVRGLFQVLLFRKLETLTGFSIVDLVDQMIGTSAGAITVAGLGLAGKTTTEMIRLFTEAVPLAFNKTWLGKLFSAYDWTKPIYLSFAKHWYDNKGLISALERIFGDVKNNNLRELAYKPCKVGIVAFGTSSTSSIASPVVFSNAFRNIDGDFTRDLYVSGSDRVMSAVLGSVSAPTFFDRVPYGQDYLIDGGIKHNNPIVLGIKEAQRRFGMLPAIIISVGTGSSSPPPSSGSLADVIARITAECTDSERDHKIAADILRDSLRGRDPKVHLHRFQPGPEIGTFALDESRSVELKNLTNAVASYLESEEKKLIVAAQHLLISDLHISGPSKIESKDSTFQFAITSRISQKTLEDKKYDLKNFEIKISIKEIESDVDTKEIKLEALPGKLVQQCKLKVDKDSAYSMSVKARVISGFLCGNKDAKLFHISGSPFEFSVDKNVLTFIKVADTEIAALQESLWWKKK